MCGDSAGGNIAASVILRAITEDIKLPKVTYDISSFRYVW